MHTPVLLNATLASLKIVSNGTYIDATFGRGGHSRAILERLGINGRLLVMDKDPEAIACAKKLAAQDPRLKVYHGSFAKLIDFWCKEGNPAVNGILFDLGVSSPQLDTATRGFSFRQEGPLDMRMDPSCGISAKDWLATVDVATLAQIFKDYADEPYARSMAKLIVTRHAENPLQTTTELAGLIAAKYPKKNLKIHPATKIFQAIRIAVNNEITELQQALNDVPKILAPDGRVAVISFHSIEDRLVKKTFAEFAGKIATQVPRRLACLQQDSHTKLLHLLPKRKADPVEIVTNPRARSAILRVAQKLPQEEVEHVS